MNFQGFGSTQLTIPPSFQCRSGLVNLFRFIQAPPPGSVIGTLTTANGSQVPLVQTQQTPLGGTPLSAVDNQNATLCGPFVQVGGQTALDVRIVNPGAPSPTGTPMSVRELLVRLILLLLRDQSPQTQLLLSQAGLSRQDLTNVLTQLQ